MNERSERTSRLSGVRFGIALPQVFTDSPVDIDAAVEAVSAAEADGLDSVWTQSQLVGRADVLEPLTLLSYMAAFSRRIRLGVGVLATPEHHPVQLAKQIASLDQLSRGRLTVGLGLGSDGTRLRLGGMPTDPLGPRLAESARLMKRLWTGDPVTFEGRFWQLEDVAMNPPPVQSPHPPLWIAGHHPNALRRSVRLGDGWIGPGAGPVEEFAGEVAALRRELDLAGRDHAGFTIAKRVYVAVEDRAEVARERLRQRFATYSRRPERALSASVHGTVEEVVAGLRRVAAAGAGLIVLNPVYDHLAQQTALTEVIRAYETGPPS